MGRGSQQGRGGLLPAAALLALFLQAAFLLGAVSGAAAAIHPAVDLAGPAPGILESDGAAMAPDGSGGVVYRADGPEGLPHVYAVPFRGGGWGAPLRVDGANPFEASEPAIAAADHGRLLVVWVQPRNVNPEGVTLYELMSATLQPGAAEFGRPVLVDADVGEPFLGDASAVDPDLAMNAGGQAYVSYRVVDNDCARNGFGEDPVVSACTLGDPTEIKVARLEPPRWSVLPEIDRAPQVPLRAPSASDAPVVAIAANGDGVVAWQEPDAEGVARIWVRRLFGQTLGNVLAAGPTQVEGRAVTTDADSPAVAISPYGAAIVGLRLEGAPGTPVPVAQIYTDSLPAESRPQGGVLSVPVALGGGAGVGGPSVAIDPTEAAALAYGAPGAVWQASGSGGHPTSPAQVGGPSVGATPTTIDPEGEATSAWVEAGEPLVGVREGFPEGGFQSAELTGPEPGPISDLALGGDGVGDALLAWSQGAPGQTEIVGSFLQASPATFAAIAPKGWQRSRRLRVHWTAAPDAAPGVTYAVYVDGDPVGAPVSALHASIALPPLGEGKLGLQVLATDSAGQRTMTRARPLLVDRSAPTVKLAATDSGRGVRVQIEDKASGLRRRSLSVSFGDGSRIARRPRCSHLYPRPGLYPVTVRVADRAGNHAVDHLRVRAR